MEEVEVDRGAGVIFLAKSSSRILLNQRSGICHDPHTWGCWGGAANPTESPKETAIREAREESGYKGEGTMILIQVSEKEGFTFFNYLAVIDDEFAPVLCDESVDYQWCSYGQWPDPLHFGIQRLLDDPKSREIIENYVAKNSPTPPTF